MKTVEYIQKYVDVPGIWGSYWVGDWGEFRKNISHHLGRPNNHDDNIFNTANYYNAMRHGKVPPMMECFVNHNILLSEDMKTITLKTVQGHQVINKHEGKYHDITTAVALSLIGQISLKISEKEELIDLKEEELHKKFADEGYKLRLLVDTRDKKRYIRYLKEQADNFWYRNDQVNEKLSVEERKSILATTPYLIFVWDQACSLLREELADEEQILSICRIVSSFPYEFYTIKMMRDVEYNEFLQKHKYFDNNDKKEKSFTLSDLLAKQNTFRNKTFKEMCDKKEIKELFNVLQYSQDFYENEVKECLVTAINKFIGYSILGNQKLTMLKPMQSGKSVGVIFYPHIFEEKVYDYMLNGASDEVLELANSIYEINKEISSDDLV